MKMVELGPETIATLRAVITSAVADAITDTAPATSVASADRVLSAQEVALKYGHAPSWVRQHQKELGAIKVGAGVRPRLLFDPNTVAKALASRSESERPGRVAPPTVAGGGRSGRRRRSGTDVPLLPYKGSRGAL